MLLHFFYFFFKQKHQQNTASAYVEIFASGSGDEEVCLKSDQDQYISLCIVERDKDVLMKLFFGFLWDFKFWVCHEDSKILRDDLCMTNII